MSDMDLLATLQQIAEAFDRLDYRTASHLLQPLAAQMPQDAGVQLYAGRLYEVQGKIEKAQECYRYVLKATVNKKVLAQARQGLQRVEAEERNSWQAAIDQAHQSPDSDQLSCLILEPVSPEQRQEMAPQFARLMKLDPYTARLLMPTRFWRFYRMGTLGTLQVYVHGLQELGIPGFCLAQSHLQGVQVLWGEKLSLMVGAGGAEGGIGQAGGQATGQAGGQAGGQIKVMCRNSLDQLGYLTLKLEEVSQVIEGALPLFESVVDLNLRKESIRKDQIKDYARVLDLHLPDRNCILRLCDQTYQFKPEGEVRKRGALMIGVKEFAGFVDTALEQEEFWKGFAPQAKLLPELSRPWEQVFHLYSALHFLK
jgi:tetratricopeptide (TPR) repeat protein